MRNVIYQAKSPVLIILFNRPKHTIELLKSIKKVKPKKLYVGIDGPRHAKDQLLIDENIELVKKMIDFDCEVKFHTQLNNLGCGLGPRSAISWFFENEEQGIILEDDCIPNESFFRFMDELLPKYDENKEVWIISGDNGGPVLNQKYFQGQDYIFTNIPLIWGWASWRDRWVNYDENLENWKLGAFKNYNILNHVNYFEKYVVSTLCKNSSKSVNKNFWDFQLYSSMMKNNGYGIIPKKNMISNIGWGEDATHTKNKNYRTKAKYGEFKTLNHPKSIVSSKKINNLITYSIHTNVSKKIINMDIIFLMRLFYIVDRVKKIIIRIRKKII